MKGRKITFEVPRETNKTGIVRDKLRVETIRGGTSVDRYLVSVNGKAYLVEPHQIINFD